MKTIITFVLVVVCSIVSNAQSKWSQEEIRLILANGMVSFVESVKPAYTPGMTYESFQNVLTKGSRPTTEGSTLIRKAHEFISKKYSNQAIIDGYSGVELARAYVKLKALESDRKSGLPTNIFNTTNGDFNPYQNKKPIPTACYWYQMSCHLSDYNAINEFGCYVSTILGMSCN